MGMTSDMHGTSSWLGNWRSSRERPRIVRGRNGRSWKPITSCVGTCIQWRHWRCGAMNHTCNQLARNPLCPYSGVMAVEELAAARATARISGT